MRLTSYSIIIFLITSFNFLITSNSLLAGDNAVILMYHRFGETTYPSTNVRLKQFEQHLAELRDKNYTVLPVREIISKLKIGESLPEKTVGITIDDGYQSVFSEAWPRLKRFNFPFTVFISTALIGKSPKKYMSWDQLRILKGAGVDIGAHTNTHNHMATSNRSKNVREILISNEKYLSELGAIPDIFAYPYGESSTEVQNLIKKLGYKSAFGQHSGPIDAKSDFFNMPRFALNENYGDMRRFRLVLRTRPLPITELLPKSPLILANNPPSLGFTINSETLKFSSLNCFSSRTGKLQLERLGRRIEIRMPKILPPGRTRINCTMPRQDGRWHWFGRLFVVPKTNKFSN